MNPPIILDVGAEQLPATSCRCAFETSGRAGQDPGGPRESSPCCCHLCLRCRNLRGRPTSSHAREHPKSVLEGIRFHIHLIRSELAADLDVVFTSDHVERIREVEDVGPTLEG